MDMIANTLNRSSQLREQALPPLKNARQMPISDPYFTASRKHSSQMSIDNESKIEN